MATCAGVRQLSLMSKAFYSSGSNLAITFILFSTGFVAGCESRETRPHGAQYLADRPSIKWLSPGDWVFQVDSHGTWSYLRSDGLVCGSVTPDPNEGWWASSDTDSHDGPVSWSSWPTMSQAENAVMGQCH